MKYFIFTFIYIFHLYQTLYVTFIHNKDFIYRDSLLHSIITFTQFYFLGNIFIHRLFHVKQFSHLHINYYYHIISFLINYIRIFMYLNQTFSGIFHVKYFFISTISILFNKYTFLLSDYYIVMVMIHAIYI